MSKKLISLIILFPFLLTAIGPNYLFALRVPSGIDEIALAQVTVWIDGQEKIFRMSVNEIKEEKFFETLLNKRMDCTIRLSREAIDEPTKTFFPYWVDRYSEWQFYRDDAIVIFKFSELTDDLAEFKKISEQLKNAGWEMKVSLNDILNPKYNLKLLKLFASLKIPKFVLLAERYSANELCSIIASMPEPNPYLLDKALVLWVEKNLNKNNQVKWLIDNDFLNKLEKRKENLDIEKAKEIIYSPKNEIYIDKEYWSNRPDVSVAYYFVRSPGSPQGLIVSLKMESDKGYIDDVWKNVSEENIEKLVATGKFVKIVGANKYAHNRAGYLLKKSSSLIYDDNFLFKVFENMPNSLDKKQWEIYLSDLKLTSAVVDVYLKLTEYLNENGKNFRHFSLDIFFHKSFLLLLHQRENIRNSIYKMLMDIGKVLDSRDKVLIKNRLRDYSGELSGAYELCINQNKVLDSLNVVLINKYENTFQECSALDKNTIYEFLFSASLYKLYTKIFGIGSLEYYLKSLAFGELEDRRIKVDLNKIQNIDFVAENLFPGGYLKDVLINFIQEHLGKGGLEVDINEKSICVKFDVPTMARFLMDAKTIEFTKKELEINNLIRQQSQLYELLEKPEAIKNIFERRESILEKINSRGQNLHISLTINNFGKDGVKKIKEIMSRQTKQQLNDHKAKMTPAAFTDKSGTINSIGLATLIFFALPLAGMIAAIYPADLLETESSSPSDKSLITKIKKVVVVEHIFNLLLAAIEIGLAIYFKNFVLENGMVVIALLAVVYFTLKYHPDLEELRYTKITDEPKTYPEIISQIDRSLEGPIYYPAAFVDWHSVKDMLILFPNCKEVVLVDPEYQNFFSEEKIAILRDMLASFPVYYDGEGKFYYWEPTGPRIEGDPGKDRRIIITVKVSEGREVVFKFYAEKAESILFFISEKRPAVLIINNPGFAAELTYDDFFYAKCLSELAPGGYLMIEPFGNPRLPPSPEEQIGFRKISNQPIKLSTEFYSPFQWWVYRKIQDTPFEELYKSSFQTKELRIKIEEMAKYWRTGLGDYIGDIYSKLQLYLNNEQQESKIHIKEYIKKSLSTLEKFCNRIPFLEIVDEYKPLAEIKSLVSELKNRCELAWDKPNEVDIKEIELIVKHLVNVVNFYDASIEKLIYEFRKSSGENDYKVRIGHIFDGASKNYGASEFAPERLADLSRKTEISYQALESHRKLKEKAQALTTNRKIKEFSGVPMKKYGLKKRFDRLLRSL